MKLPEKQIRYIERTDIHETFVDALGLTTFDGHSMRVELCILRYDQPNPPKPMTARKYTAARLALTPEVTVELFNQLQGMINVMKQQGMVTHKEPPKEGPSPVH